MSDDLERHAANAVSAVDAFERARFKTATMLSTPERVAWIADHLALIDSLIAGTHVVVPREPTEAMWIAGRKPILARDVLQGGGSSRFTLGDHMRAIGDAAYARGDELRLQRLSKGDCAVMVYRAMLAATPSPAKPED